MGKIQAFTGSKTMIRKKSGSEVWDNASNFERKRMLKHLGYTTRDTRTSFNELSTVKQIKILKNMKSGTNYLELKKILFGGR